MRSLSSWLLGPALQEISGASALVFFLHLSLVQVGARLAGMEASLRWATWSVSATWIAGEILGLLAGFAGLALPPWGAGLINVVILALFVRLNYFGATWKGAWAVSVACTVATVAIAYVVARLLDRFVAGW